jgi:hypothetical protein
LNALLISPKFFGYECVIQKSLEKLGYCVDFISDRPFNNSFLKAAYRLSCRPFDYFVNEFYNKILNQKSKTLYDIILVINGEALTPKIITILRRNYPTSKFIYYTWDSFVNKPRHCLNSLSSYDKVFSFDPIDANLFGMQYHALFFSDEIESTIDRKDICDIDLIFIGTGHSDRLSIIRSLQKTFSESDINFYLYIYLQGRWVYLLRKITNLSYLKSNISDFKFKALEQKEIKSLFRRSKVILDIQHTNQSGMTMRTLEALGARKKLITTNAFIANADFYDPENILIFDRKNFSNIDRSFFIKPFKPISENIIKKYHIDNWILDIIKECP